MSTRADHHTELLRESAVKVSRIMELHESIVDIVNEDKANGATECGDEMAVKIAPLYAELLSELRMVSTRLIIIAAALATHSGSDEAMYQARVIAENELLNFISNLPGIGIIFMGDDDAE